MKLIRAIVKPYKIEEVCSTLDALGIKQITTYEACEYSSANILEKSKITPRIVVEVLAESNDTGAILTALVASSRTGKGNDGIVYVLPINEIVAIDTGESGPYVLR